MADFTLDNAAGYFYRDQDGAWTSENISGLEGVTAGDAFTFSVTGEDGSTLDFKVPTAQTANGRAQLTMAITLDLSKLVTPDANTALVTSVDRNNGMGIGPTSDRVTATVWNNSIPWNSNTVGNTLGDSGLITLVFTTADMGSKYAVGEGSYTDFTGLKGSQSFADIAVSNVASETLVALALWQDADTTDGSATLTAVYNTMGALSQSYSVPEPATATLSLLALGGLAARRRRA